MKKIQEMSHEEICTLTKSQVERLIDIACAEAGIPMVEKPEEPEYESEELETTGFAYVVGRIAVRSRDVAEAIQSLLETYKVDILDMDCYQYISLLITNPNYKPRLGIEQIPITTEDYRKANAVVANRNEKTRKLYEDQLVVYGHYQEARTEKASSIYELWNKHLSIQAEVEYLQARLKNYWHLAEGHQDIALKFYSDAYSERHAKIKKYLDARQFLQDLDFEPEQPMEVS